ncbi:MAG TPA: class I SAM-dependent methyltransferase [Candidatus Acidoferrales bacterium]|jgi:ubiquinone/menaquinone biosynthesis C-methylase UbiE|nr:class I SAM-dependent methyltransferase [Candidatus Acidoferrales bacterium]
MGLFKLTRIPEPEVMDDSSEVEAYTSASAQEFLDRIDDTFVDHALRLIAGKERGRALDIGCGPGQIVLKLARRLKLWKFVAVDRAPNMIAQARENLIGVKEAAGRVEFQENNGNQLAFADETFDFVMCNSVLHHFAQPRNLFAEMARVAKPGAAILLRDLRRPSALAYPFHVRWHGRRYSGTMYQLYKQSVRAAYTVPELRAMLASSPLTNTRVFAHHSTHLGIERPIAAVN